MTTEPITITAEGAAEAVPPYRIPEGALPVAQERLEKLNKLAAKLGNPPISITVVDREYVTGTDEDGFPTTNLWYHVTVDGAAPRLAGWTFAAEPFIG